MFFLGILRDMRAQYRDVQRRFVPKVDRRGPDECWSWLARRNGPSPRADGTMRDSYGTFQVRGRVVYAHRWALFGIAALTRKDKALHHCDTPLCCNPAHMYAGTGSDNLRDAEERARVTRIRGRFARVRPHIGDLIHLGPTRSSSSLDACAEPVDFSGKSHPIAANDIVMSPTVIQFGSGGVSIGDLA